MEPSGSEAGEGLRNALRPGLSRAPLTTARRHPRLSPAGAAGVLYASLCHSMKPPPSPADPPQLRIGKEVLPPTPTAEKGSHA